MTINVLNSEIVGNIVGVALGIALIWLSYSPRTNAAAKKLLLVGGWVLVGIQLAFLVINIAGHR